jgi:alpha-mannosidase
VQNFVDASGSSGGLTMSSSVSVFDWKDPTNHPAASPVLQPILLASRKSCNGEGNWYPQAGDHHYRFSLTSHDGGWRNGWQPAIAANHPLQPVLDPRRHEDARLPESLSFLQVSTPNIVVSAVKKCEDDDSLVVRCYDIEGTNRRPTFTLFSPLLSAEHTNLIEEEGKPMAVADKTFSLDVGHHAIETVKLKLKSGPVLP